MFEGLEGQEGYALLGRMEGDVPGYLSYGAEEGEVLCVFGSVAGAEEFYERWRVRIPGEGWRAVWMEGEDLAGVARNFDLVSVDPNPVPDTEEYLTPVEDFIRGLPGAR